MDLGLGSFSIDLVHIQKLLKSDKEGIVTSSSKLLTINVQNVTHAVITRCANRPYVDSKEKNWLQRLVTRTNRVFVHVLINFGSLIDNMCGKSNTFV